MNIVTVSELKKNYGSFEALKGISLEIEKGKIFAILGPNGAGKSTLIKILVTVLEKDSGKIIINGFDMDTNQNEIKRIIGYVGQDTDRSAYARLTSKENLMFFGQLQGMSKKQIQNQIDLLCNYFSSHELLDKEIGTLSGGQRQLVIIMRALLHNPALIILDEPTKGLDPAIAKKMRNFLKKYIEQEKKTIILTSHILHEVEELSDTVILIHKARIIRQGTPKELTHSLGTSAFFEVNKASISDEILKQVSEIFPPQKCSTDEWIAFPLKDIYDDSAHIFKIMKSHTDRVVFRYHYTTLEDVFFKEVDDFNDKFE